MALCDAVEEEVADADSVSDWETVRDAERDAVNVCDAEEELVAVPLSVGDDDCEGEAVELALVVRLADSDELNEDDNVRVSELVCEASSVSDEVPESE